MRILTKFRVDSESAIKTCNFEKVYTSDPKQSISKKFTLLTQNMQFRKSLHFWLENAQIDKVHTSDPKPFQNHFRITNYIFLGSATVGARVGAVWKIRKVRKMTCWFARPHL